MKKGMPQEELQKYCKRIKEEISNWKDINQNGCNDPFWSDGCNLNLVRNHIIYYKEEIRKICNDNKIELPEEYHLSIPPKADNDYMANLKQTERVKRIFYGNHVPVKRNYTYDEQQLCLAL